MTTPDLDQPTEQKKRGGCMKWVLIGLGVIFVMALIAGLTADPDDEVASEETVTSAPVEPEATPEPEPSPEPAPEPEPEAEPDKAGQRDELIAALDSWFDGCTWVDDDSEHTVRSSCAENELGVIVGNSATDVGIVLDGMSEAADSVPGGYAIEDNWAVWSTDQGNINLASDVLGVSSGRESF